MPVELAIRNYLISHGITQAFIARKCGWSRTKTNTILTGKQKIRADEMQAVCDAVGVPYDYFYNVAAAAQDSA